MHGNLTWNADPEYIEMVAIIRNSEVVHTFFWIANLSDFVVQVRDLNELSRKEVDEIIKLCMKQDCISPNDNIRKRLPFFCLTDSLQYSWF